MTMLAYIYIYILLDITWQNGDKNPWTDCCTSQTNILNFASPG